VKHILQEFANTTWAILPQQLQIISTVLMRWSAGFKLSPEEIRAAVGNDPEIAAARREQAKNSPGGVAVLPLYGVISNRIHHVQDISGPGGTSTEGFSRRFREAVDNPSIGSIVIDIDSPGGNVHGIQALSDEIYNARKKKHIVAVANSMAASAAYWIGTAADEFIMAPGGDVGSIGAMMVHEDLSAFVNAVDSPNALPQVELITSSEYKAEGNPFGPLSDESREFFQQRVNEYHNSFVKAVARGRGTTVKDVNENFGQGRVYGAEQALSVGMVDAIDTLDNVIVRLASGKKQPASRRNANRLAIAEQV
jgi:signal peptide peptidase SppA